MSFPKVLALITTVLFATICIASFFKEKKPKAHTPIESSQEPFEVELDDEIQQKNPPIKIFEEKSVESEEKLKAGALEELADADRIEMLFRKGPNTLPIVETITYKSRVAWQKGRPAWLSDYATYYATSRHFIARSLNGKPDYFLQNVADGDTFNVFKKDKNIQFHLLVDASKCKLWFYYVDLDAQERVLLKTYSVGLGRKDETKSSGLLTPLGKYFLGNRIAIFKPKMMGHYRGQKTEMIRIFGTRWIPFEKEVGSCSSPAKGFGIHGTPWVLDEKGQLVDNAAVWLGAENELPLTVEKDCYITLPKAARKGMTVELKYEGPISAPISKGDVVGKLVISAPTLAQPIEVPLVAAVTIDKASFWKRIKDSLSYLIFGKA